jgi:uncharacterized membrane protein YjdF
MKIKHYGKFRKFMKDRRLGQLVQYFNVDEIKRDDLQTELDKYEKGRLKLMDTILQFEKAAAQRWMPQLKEAHNREQHYIQHFAYLKVANDLLPLKEITSLNLDQIQELRKKFAHNEVPFSDWLLEKVRQVEGGQSPVDRLMQLSIGFYEALIDRIKTTEYATNTAAALA